MKANCIIDYYGYDQIRIFAKNNDKSSIKKYFTYEQIDDTFNKLSIIYNLSDEKKELTWIKPIMECITELKGNHI